MIVVSGVHSHPKLCAEISFVELLLWSWESALVSALKCLKMDHDQALITQTLNMKIRIMTEKYKKPLQTVKCSNIRIRKWYNHPNKLFPQNFRFVFKPIQHNYASILSQFSTRRSTARSLWPTTNWETFPGLFPFAPRGTRSSLFLVRRFSPISNKCRKRFHRMWRCSKVVAQGGAIKLALKYFNYCWKKSCSPTAQTFFAHFRFKIFFFITIRRGSGKWGKPLRFEGERIPSAIASVWVGAGSLVKAKRS